MEPSDYYWNFSKGKEISWWKLVGVTSLVGLVTSRNFRLWYFQVKIRPFAIGKEIFFLRNQVWTPQVSEIFDFSIDPNGKLQGAYRF